MTQADRLDAAGDSLALLHLDPRDDVAVALRPVAAGEKLTVGARSIAAAEAIASGHKLALRDMSAGETVHKFGWPIGRLTAPVAAGAHLHIHNLRTLLSGVEGYAYAPAPGRRSDAGSEAAAAPSFLGYRRADGRVGTRNEIWILPTVRCVGRTAQKIAAVAHARHAGIVDGVHTFAHPFGCSQLGDDLAGTRDILAALAAHPNAGGVLLVGLGCESNQLARLLKDIDPALHGKIRSVAAQFAGDEIEEGLALVDELVEQAAAVARTE